MTRPCIGILGGMGPAATILLQQRILDAVPAERDEDHIPLLIDMNPQVPSRIDFLIHQKGPNPGPFLAGMARNLQEFGADALVMPCNTAHHFADDIENATEIPFLNMVQLTAEALAKQAPKGGGIGILASPATDKVGLFHNVLGASGLKALASKNSQDLLTTIQDIKARGPSENSIAQTQNAIGELQDAGADAFLVGCSEFSLISRKLRASVPIIDAIDVLTDAICNFRKPLDHSIQFSRHK